MTWACKHGCFWASDICEYVSPRASGHCERANILVQTACKQACGPTRSAKGKKAEKTPGLVSPPNRCTPSQPHHLSPWRSSAQQSRGAHRAEGRRPRADGGALQSVRAAAARGERRALRPGGYSVIPTRV